MTPSRERRGGLATWLLGLVDGVLLGFPGLILGITGVAIVLLIAAVSAAFFRSRLLLSGMLVGAGGLWTGLLLRQMILICNEPGRSFAGSCVSSGLATFAAFTVGVLLIGIAAAAVGIRRHRPAEEP